MNTPDYSIGLLPWIFLGVGLVVGIILVLRLRKHNTVATSAADVALRIQDLEQQRREILARLSGDTEEDLTAEDRRLLELQAAKIFQELDEFGDLQSEPSREPGSTGVSPDAQPATTSTSSNRGFWARHPALGGALLGGGIVALVAALILLAVGDAQPRQDDPAAMQAAPQQGSPAPASASQPPLPPFLQQQVNEMRAQLETAPENTQLRTEMALMLLSADRPFDAFQEANQVLQLEPENAQALYITGFVRYLMGQPTEAMAQFDRALNSTPSYSQAWLVKGLIQLQLGLRAEAISTWEEGLQATGGTDPRLENLIREAKTDKSVEEILSNPPQ